VSNLLSILAKAPVWNPGNDRKIGALQNLIDNTHKLEKVLVFTQFADTAHYIYEQLTSRGIWIFSQISSQLLRAGKFGILKKNDHRQGTIMTSLFLG
jgi:ERCC4-related helicase